MAILSNAVTMADAGGISASLGSKIHIKTLTSDGSDDTLTFVHGASSVVLDGTYPIYQFIFNSIHPQTNAAEFGVLTRDGGTDYDGVKTTNFLSCNHGPGSQGGPIAEDFHVRQSAGLATLALNVGADNDENCSGYMYLYSPASTTFTKFFQSRMSVQREDGVSVVCFCAGHSNHTAAITGVQFKFSSGQIQAGSISLYGIKDS